MAYLFELPQQPAVAVKGQDALYPIGRIFCVGRNYADHVREMGNDPAAGTTSWVHGEPARLDYCFVSNELKHLIRDCRVDNDATGSDHLPLWVEIDI